MDWGVQSLLAHQQKVDVEALRRLHVVLRDIAAGQQLDVALRAVTQAVSEVIGFGVVVANLVVGERVRVVAVTGSEEARAQLEGLAYRRQVFERILDESEAWGELRFHRNPTPLLDDAAADIWVGSSDQPPLQAPYVGTGRSSPWGTAEPGDEDDPRARWDDLNLLLAPMRSARGHLTGLLCADQPADGRMPSHTQCELLEIFAVQTGVALDNRELLADLTVEHDRLRSREMTLRRVFDSAPIGMWTIALAEGVRGRVAQVNGALCRIFGYSEAEFADLTMADLTDNAADPGLDGLLRRAAQGVVELDRIETSCVRRDGSVFWGQIHLAAMQSGTETRQAPYLLAQIIDVSARRASEQELAHRAAHDPLTGLLNRTVIAERLQLVLGEERGAGRPGAILFCDLDHFKQVNDRHGHLVGDEVLAGVAQRIGAVVRRSDSVGRYGGDEFLVLVPEISADEAQQMAVRLVAAVNEPFVVRGESCEVGVSVGVVMLRVDAVATAAEVLVVADEAMYHAKSMPGPTRFVVRDL